MKAQHHLLAFLIAAFTVYAFAAPNAQLFVYGDLARIMFFHVPCAFLTMGLMLVSLYQAIRWFATRDLKWEAWLGATLELGALFSILTITTGMIFSKVQWGHFWHWDPRQTSFLLVVLLYLGAIALRGAFTDELRRAPVTAAYTIGLSIMGIFLSAIYPRIPAINKGSVHPSTTILNNELDNWYRVGFYGLLILLAFLAGYICRMRARVTLLEQQLDNQDEHQLEHGGGGHAGAPGVVRPVAVSEDGGSTSGSS